MFLKVFKKLLFGRTYNIMNFVDLIELVVARKQWVQREHLEEHSTSAPQVHLVSVVTVGQQAFGGSVPPSADVLSEGLLRVKPPSAAEVRDLDLLVEEQDVLRLDIPVENAVSMHVVNSL